jgi:hypothetical protein
MSVELALSQVDAYFVSPAFNGSSTARDEVGILMKNALVKTENIDEAIAKLFKDAVGKCKFSVK